MVLNREQQSVDYRKIDAHVHQLKGSSSRYIFASSLYISNHKWILGIKSHFYSPCLTRSSIYSQDQGGHMEGFIPFMDDFFPQQWQAAHDVPWLLYMVMVSLLKNQICNTELVICLKRMLHQWLAKESQSNLASVQLSMHCPILLNFFFLVNQSWKNGWLLWLCITFLYQIKRSMLHIFLSRQNLGHISPWTYSSLMPLPSVILPLKKGLEITALGLKEFRKSALASATSARSET